MTKTYQPKTTLRTAGEALKLRTGDQVVVRLILGSTALVMFRGQPIAVEAANLT